MGCAAPIGEGAARCRLALAVHLLGAPATDAAGGDVSPNDRALGEGEAATLLEEALQVKNI